MRDALRVLFLGTLLGLAILGVGGRLVMAAIAIDSGQRPAFTLGGTMTVVVLGAVSGLAGGAIALASRFIAVRFLGRWPWTAYPLFATSLVLVTARGLRGAPPRVHWYFYLLVALYGVALALLASRRRLASDPPQSQRPGRLASE
jgi:hypothetical protein